MGRKMDDEWTAIDGWTDREIDGMINRWTD